MASSSYSPSAPAYYSQSWKYDVFLSFRGEDTRKTIVDHLYSALEQQGIYTYKDDETLPRGELIGPTLMKSIEESHIAVIVFSENYANSSWCLDELTCIMKCKYTKGQIVIPIFYDVDPSEVRKQKRKYGEAFSIHELENKKKVESWRKALMDASNISGWELKHIANGHESKGIKLIVAEISQKLHQATSSANENLIGIAVRMQRLRSDLQVGSGGVGMIGIWGVGGGGKTTLASSIYEEVSNMFDGCCFIHNIREESRRYGLEKLQEKIISEMDVNGVGGGRRLINNRFRHQKVLIVLDDVDQVDQLKALVGSHNWFGEGSRVIITTRDEHLLIAHKVDVIHDISLLNDDEAIMLFHKHAPRDNRPMEDYRQLSKEVVSYSGGLPLALTVLGSFLCDKDINEWKSALARLKEISDNDIVEKLKISFDGLKPVEKELFLDIACFFRWENVDRATEMLDASGFHPVIGVKVLIQKALITISDDERFNMHDLVQEMGHHIVRVEHPNNPEKHSRLWKREDVMKICAMDATTGLDMIEAVRFNNDGDLPPVVANTKNLRWIDWNGDFASHLLSNFPQWKLCCLNLHGSLQKQLWEGYKLLPNLKRMELCHMYNLIMTPNFDGLPNLEFFHLADCLYLKEIHPSIGRLEKLVLLSIVSCRGLVMFPPITGPKKLHTLSFISSQTLFKLSEIKLHNPLVNCWRWGCNNLGGVECCSEDPSSLHNNMKPCLPDHHNMNHIGLQFSHIYLRQLYLSYCNLGDEEMDSAIWELPILEMLDLGGNNFSQLSFSRLRLPQLKLLIVSGCPSLVALSELPSSIAIIKANSCMSLKSFGDISNCNFLWKISLMGENNIFADILLDSMLQGNVIEYFFISIIFKYQIPKRFLGTLFKGTRFTLHLPNDWYNDFCGFLLCVLPSMEFLDINIVIKQEADEEDSLFESWQESNEAVETEYDEMKTCVGYISFDSLRPIGLINSSYTLISVSLDGNYESYIGVELVPRRTKGDQVQTKKVTTDYSEFWDVECEDGPAFRMQQDSKSSINIIWRHWDDSF